MKNSTMEYKVNQIYEELKRLIQWHPDSEEKFIQKMVCFLLPGQRKCWPEAIDVLRQSLKTEYGMIFVEKYREKLEWLDSVSLLELERKTGNIYRKVNGNYPQISRCSLRIIHLLYMKQKMIFTKSKEYYIHRIRRFWGTGEFSFHSFRYYRRKLEMGITIGIQVPKVIPV